jgi:hypothetical protein
MSLSKPPIQHPIAGPNGVVPQVWVQWFVNLMASISSGGGGGVTDHGALTGLADDDHTQYHNNARGDARYSLLAHNHSGVYSPVGHSHTASDVSDFNEAVDDRVASLVVAGSNITATYNDGAGTLTIDATASSISSEQIEVDFGATENALASETVTAAWVTTASRLVASLAYESTADHDPDDALAEGILVSVGNIIDGVGFDVVLSAPNNTWGKYKVNVIGA